MMKYKNKNDNFLLLNKMHALHTPKNNLSRYANGVITYTERAYIQLLLDDCPVSFLVPSLQLLLDDCPVSFLVPTLNHKNHISMKCMIIKKLWSRVITFIEMNDKK
jgi:hypothetical protein